MCVQRRSEGKSARFSRDVPDSHQMPIVKARLCNDNRIPADMKGCAMPAACRLDFGGVVASIRFETGNVTPGTGIVLDRGSAHLVRRIIAAKGCQSLTGSAPSQHLPPWERKNKRGAPARSTISRTSLNKLAAQRPNKNGTLAPRDAGGRCGGKQKRRQAVAPTVQQRQSKRMRVRRPHNKERRKRASGSANKRRTLKERSGKECAP
jgi:hypothetical protein